MTQTHFSDRQFKMSMCTKGAIYQNDSRTTTTTRTTTIQQSHTPEPEEPLLLTCCQKACPAGTDVSAYTALVAQGRSAEALAIVREENPFPGACGRVCDHPCEGHCRRAESDHPVAIRSLKRFLADHERAGGVLWPERIVPTRAESVAVIGAGPAGLTAASDLLRRNFHVTIFEALPVAGGMMRVGIPDYRLPPDVLDFDLEHLRRLGIEIRLNEALGREFTLSDLKTQGYGAVLLATGTHGSRRLDVKGAELPGVTFSVDFLRQVKLGGSPEVGRRVVDASEHPDAAAMHETPDARVDGRAYQRAHGVDVDTLEFGHGYACAQVRRRQVVNDVDALQRALLRGQVGNIALRKLEATRFFQVAHTAQMQVECDDRITPGCQIGRQVRADEPAGAGYQDPAHAGRRAATETA